jgi:TPR repeat protein
MTPHSRRHRPAFRLAPWAAVAGVLAVACVSGVARGDAGGTAARGTDPSTLRAARAFEHGEGVGKNLSWAASLYCQAAREGDPEGLYALGWMYANGRGLPRDDATAAALFSLAAEAGHRQAASMLAVVGAKGELPECMRPPVVVANGLAGIESELVRIAVEPDPFAELSPAKRKIADAVEKLAPRFSIEPRLALAVIAVESNFQPGARSDRDARGLMQLIPETAARFNVKNPYNVTDNVRGGLTYLRWLLSYYQGQVPFALAAYNAGEKAVDRHRGIPPYAETRDYVRRILELYGSDRHPYDARIVTPSPVVATGVPGSS